DPKASLGWVAAAAIMVGLAGATFDIVIDAYRIELLEPRQLGVGSGMSQYGWRIGSNAAGGLALYLAADFGWAAAYAVCALFALPAVLAGLIVGEPTRKVNREWPERMGQRAYLMFILAFLPLYLGARWIDAALGVNILSNMVLVGYLSPLFELTARRSRDAGRPSALAWIGLVPIAGVGMALWRGWTTPESIGLLIAGALALLWVASL